MTTCLERAVHSVYCASFVNVYHGCFELVLEVLGKNPIASDFGII